MSLNRIYQAKGHPSGRTPPQPWRSHWQSPSGSLAHSGRWSVPEDSCCVQRATRYPPSDWRVCPILRRRALTAAALCRINPTPRASWVCSAADRVAAVECGPSEGACHAQPLPRLSLSEADGMATAQPPHCCSVHPPSSAWDHSLVCSPPPLCTPSLPVTPTLSVCYPPSATLRVLPSVCYPPCATLHVLPCVCYPLGCPTVCPPPPPPGR